MWSRDTASHGRPLDHPEMGAVRARCAQIVLASWTDLKNPGDGCRKDCGGHWLVGGAGSLQTEDAVASICRFLLHSLGSGVWSE